MGCRGRVVKGPCSRLRKISGLLCRRGNGRCEAGGKGAGDSRQTVEKLLVTAEEEGPVASVIDVGNDHGPAHHTTELVSTERRFWRACGIRVIAVGIQGGIAEILPRSPVEPIGAGFDAEAFDAAAGMAELRSVC